MLVYLNARSVRCEARQKNGIYNSPLWIYLPLTCRTSFVSILCVNRQVHAYIIGYLRAQMPSMMGKEKVQKKLTAGKRERLRLYRRKRIAAVKPRRLI